MQLTFDFGTDGEIARMRARLRQTFGVLGPVRRLGPADQLVRSLIGSRTRDEVSWPSFLRLKRRYPRWPEMAAASPGEVEVPIAAVTFADVKARYLGAAFRAILAERPDLDLGFLGRWTVRRSLAWVERLPGAGPKVAASVLNFSTLARPTFVVDTHVLRVLRRFGLVGQRADARRAGEVVVAATAGWSAVELTEMHALLKRLGQTACRAGVPDCAVCPLRGGCRTARGGSLPS